MEKGMQKGMVRIVPFEEISHGRFFDTYVWQLFQSKIALFLILSSMQWSINSLFCVFLIWLRTGMEEFNGRVGITLLLILMMLSGSNWSLLQLLIPFEVTRWLCVTQQSWMPTILTYLSILSFWIPADMFFILSHISEAKIVITDNGFLIVLPRNRILCLNPRILIPDTVAIGDEVKCSRCERPSKQIYPLPCEHALCPSCYYTRLLRYGNQKLLCQHQCL